MLKTWFEVLVVLFHISDITILTYEIHKQNRFWWLKTDMQQEALCKLSGNAAILDEIWSWNTHTVHPSLNDYRSDSVQSGQNCPCRKDEHRQAILGFNTPQGPCYVMLHLMGSWILQMLFQLKTSSRPRKACTETVQILSMKELFINWSWSDPYHSIAFNIIPSNYINISFSIIL